MNVEMVIPKDERVGDRGHGPKLAGPYADSRARASGFIILLGRVGRGRTDYRVRSTDYGRKVGGWFRCVLSLVRRPRLSLAPTRERVRERQLGWHAVPTLPEARIQLGQHMVLSLPESRRAGTDEAPPKLTV